ncbi:MAG: EamA family transporter [Steroidobacteraceae bacterium]
MNAARAGRTRTRLRLLAAFGIVYLVWGSSYLASRVGVLHLPPLLFAGVRFVIAGLVMLVVSRLIGVRVRPAGREWRDLAVLALLAFVISNGLSIWAMQWLPSNQAALNVSAPLWIVRVRRLRRARPPAGKARTRRTALGFLGTALVVRPHGAPGHRHGLRAARRGAARLPVVGDGHHLPAHVGPRIAVQALIGWQMLLGGIGLTLVGLARGRLRPGTSPGPARSRSPSWSCSPRAWRTPPTPGWRCAPRRRASAPTPT